MSLSPFKTPLAPLLVFALAMVVSTQARPQQRVEDASQDVLLTADRILDVRTGRIIRGGHVLVRNGRIVEVGPGSAKTRVRVDFFRVPAG